MDDPLSFLAKFFGSTWKVGFAFAIAALIIFSCRRARVEPFESLDQHLWGVIAVAGLVGGCLALVEAARSATIFVNRKGSSIISEYTERHARKRNALRNLNAITEEQAKALLFLRRNETKRFLGPCQNDLLYQLKIADFIAIDDPNIKPYSTKTYYQVPVYVWNAIEDHLGQLPTPAHAPWLPTPEEEWRRKHGIW
jgi:hypothetical protein